MPGLDFYLNAYEELQHDRPIGMAAGSIPFSSILRWAEFNQITNKNDIQTLINHIRVMEDATRETDQGKDKK